MFNRIPPAGTGGSFNLCSTESHRREPVDRSIYVQPNPTGGNRWIVQFMFNRIPPAGTGGSFNLCSTESHRREPVDRSIYVQPNPTRRSRGIENGRGHVWNPSH